MNDEKYVIGSGSFRLLIGDCMISIVIISV